MTIKIECDGCGKTERVLAGPDSEHIKTVSIVFRGMGQPREMQRQTCQSCFDRAVCEADPATWPRMGPEVVKRPAA